MRSAVALPQKRIFERKELSLRILTALRKADVAPMTLEAIAARIVADKGLNAAAEPMVRPVAIIALKALQKPAPADPRRIAPPSRARALSMFAISLNPSSPYRPGGVVSS
jgi:hypothetical protein